MKAKLTNFPNYILTLSPESVDDKVALQEVALTIGSGRMITSRGFKYMSEDVLFYIQPMPGSD